MLWFIKVNELLQDSNTMSVGGGISPGERFFLILSSEAWRPGVTEMIVSDWLLGVPSELFPGEKGRRKTFKNYLICI